MRLKFLLVNPWITDFTAYDLWMKPLGLLYIASVLSKWNIDIYFINCVDNFHPSIPEKFRKIRKDGTAKIFFTEIEKPDFLRIIPRKFKLFGIPVSAFDEEIGKIGKIDGVFITSMMTYWYPGVQIAIDRIRKKRGSVPIILGGVYPTLIPEHARKESGADIIVEGEGENQLGKILNELFSLNREFEYFNDINSIPFPQFALLRERKSLPFLTSRGCPFRCSYCASFLIFGKFRERSVENCIEELEFIKNNFETEHIAFYDDALLLNSKKRIKPLLMAILGKSLRFTFHTPNGLHIKEIDEELAILMKRTNFKTIRLSFESVNKDFLLKSYSEHKIGDLKKVIETFKKAGFEGSNLEVYILVGLPFQEMEEVEESIRYAGEYGVKVRLAYFSPIPNTKEWEIMERNGLLPMKDEPLVHNKVLFPYLWSKITSEKLEYLKKLQRKINEKNS